MLKTIRLIHGFFCLVVTFQLSYTRQCSLQTLAVHSLPCAIRPTFWVLPKVQDKRNLHRRKQEKKEPSDFKSKKKYKTQGKQMRHVGELLTLVRINMLDRLLKRSICRSCYDKCYSSQLYVKAEDNS